MCKGWGIVVFKFRISALFVRRLQSLIHGLLFTKQVCTHLFLFLCQAFSTNYRRVFNLECRTLSPLSTAPIITTISLFNINYYWRVV
jgi:hypothetical protein